jgi:hypothetical protein
MNPSTTVNNIPVPTMKNMVAIVIINGTLFVLTVMSQTKSICYREMWAYFGGTARILLSFATNNLGAARSMMACVPF